MAITYVESYDQSNFVTFPIADLKRRRFKGKDGRAGGEILIPRWVLVMSGVAQLQGPGFGGVEGDRFHTGIAELFIDLTPAVTQTGLDQSLTYGFQIDAGQMAPLGTLATLFDADTAVDMGFSATRTEVITTTLGDEERSNCFQALRIHLGTHDGDAYIRRVGYYVTLVGRWMPYTYVGL